MAVRLDALRTHDQTEENSLGDWLASWSMEYGPPPPPPPTESLVTQFSAEPRGLRSMPSVVTR